MAFHDEPMTTNEDVYLPPDAAAEQYVQKEVERANRELTSLTRRQEELRRELAIVDSAVGTWSDVHKGMATILDTLNSEKSVSDGPRQSRLASKRDGGL